MSSTLPSIEALIGLGASLAAALAIAWRAFPDSVRPVLLGLNRRSAGLRERIVSIDGHRVHALTRGEITGHEPPLVLLHGIFAEKDHWVDFVRALPGRPAVVVPDLPGFGQSDRLETARYGYAEQVQRLAALLDALGIERAHLAGSSMGGTLAALFALRHPQRVASLAFIGAPHGLRSAVPSPADRLIDAGRSPLIAHDATEFDAMMQRLFKRRPWLPYPVLQAARRDALERASSNRRLWQEHVADRYRLHDCVGELRAPVFALWGMHDRIFDVSGVEVLRARLPGAEVQVMDDVGHLPLMESPARSARLYARFLASLRSPSGLAVGVH
jgi:abhydrolase domain-containing protein 6